MGRLNSRGLGSNRLLQRGVAQSSLPILNQRLPNDQY